MRMAAAVPNFRAPTETDMLLPRWGQSQVAAIGAGPHNYSSDA